MDGSIGMECNICGARDFVEYRSRGDIRCAGCGSIERNRLVALYLDRFVTLRPGLKVLHFAPERPIAPRLAKVIGPSYHVRDIDVERYKGMKKTGVSVEKFDLCTDCESLPSDHYDLILHNHVMEHIPCNVTAVLWHLHRALAPDGLHMFSIPVVGQAFEESFVEMSPEERTERFKQHDHVRNFSRKDLDLTLGMLFDIEESVGRTLVDLFGEETLRRYNIPENRWRKFNGGCLFVLKKTDLKLRACSAGRAGN